MVDSAAQMCREVLRAVPDMAVLGVGVSVPGLVRTADGLVHFAPNLGWTDVAFVDLLSDSLGLPVVVGNDADLGVLAEHLYGAAVGASEVAYVGGTVGIGGGFLVRGQPLRGAEGYAGEVGHMIVDSDGAAVPLRLARLLGDQDRVQPAAEVRRPAHRRWPRGRRGGRLAAAQRRPKPRARRSTTRRTGWGSGCARWSGCSTPRSWCSAAPSGRCSTRAPTGC